MGDILNLAEQFFLSLSLGVTILFFIIQTEKTGAGLMRLFSSVAGISSFVACLLYLSYGPLLSPQSLAYLLASFFHLIVYLNHKDQKSPVMWGLYIGQILTMSFALWEFHNHNLKVWSFFLSSTLLLGSVTFSMILGHWYLVTPKLSEKLLLKGVHIMIGILVLKVILTTVMIGMDWQLFQSGAEGAMGYMFNWIMLSMRVGWGYLVVAGMSYFTWRLVRMRSIQSATGVLYAMTFFVFIGELISSYFFFEYGVYL